MALRLPDLPWRKRNVVREIDRLSLLEDPTDDDIRLLAELLERVRCDRVEQATAAPGEKRNVRFEGDCS